MDNSTTYSFAWEEGIDHDSNGDGYAGAVRFEPCSEVCEIVIAGNSPMKQYGPLPEDRIYRMVGAWHLGDPSELSCTVSHYP